MTNPADEIRASCREIIYMLDSRAQWPGEETFWSGWDGDDEWREQFHQEAVRLRELLKDHEDSASGKSVMPTEREKA